MMMEFPEKQNHRPSLTGHLRALRSSFGRHNNNERNYRCMDNSSRTTHIIPISPTTSTRNGYTLNLSPVDGIEPSQDSRNRQVSLPLRRTHRSLVPGELDYLTKSIPKSSLERNATQIQHLVSRVRRESFLPRSWTTVETNRKPAYSRLPTPSEPPKGELYSHSVYRKEGRRSVLSFLGRRCASITRDIEKKNLRHVRYSGLIQNDPEGQSDGQSRPRTQASFSGLGGEGSKHDDRGRSLPIRVIRPPSTQSLIKNSQPKEGANGGDSRVVYNASVRKAHALQLPLLHLSQPTNTTNDLSNPKQTDYPYEEKRKMGFPKRIRLTQGHENLKRPENQDFSSRIATIKKRFPRREPGKQNESAQNSNTRQVNDSADSEYHVVDPEALSIEVGTRGKYQAQKRAPSSTDHSSNIVKSRRRAVSNSQANPSSQIQRVHPQQYWLGRLVTLTNAFHYEDSFNQPDIATGHCVISSYSRPFQCPEHSNSKYRVKRAFKLLENLCVTDEASKSLRDFRDSYIKRFGDQWMA